MVLFLFLGAWVGEDFSRYSQGFASFFTHAFSWLYMLISAGSLIFLTYLALSRFGDVVLGDPDDQPEFSNLSWYAMLFSAGMEASILFYGGAEPISHYLHPPTADPRSLVAAREALRYTAFHWGLNAWAIYGVCAVAMGYFGFRKRKKYLISSAIVELTDDEHLATALKVVSDWTATLAVIFGVAASLVLGVTQIASGFNHVAGLGIEVGTPEMQQLRMGVLAVITVLYILSAATGLDRGIKILSNVNMGLASGLLLFMLFAGPTLFILKVFVDTIGGYLANLPELCFMIAPFTPEYEQWMGQWTLLYFTWWISWAPFVGIFIARISKGRTIRELVTAVVIVPTLFSVLWFSVFGGSALYLEIFGGGGIAGQVETDITLSLFALLGHFPGSQFTSVLALVLLFTFMVTSADSACMVISMMTTEGDLEPSMTMKVLWGLILAAVTLMLVLGAGLQSVQAAALTFAFPFALVMVLMAFSIKVRLGMQVERKRI